MCLGESVDSITATPSVHAPVKHKFLPKRPLKQPQIDYGSLIQDIGYEENVPYSMKTIVSLRQLKESKTELSDKQVLDLMQLLLCKIKNSPDCTHCYWWSSLFKSLEYLPARFFNCHIDVTALVLLKCYELLSLNTRTNPKLKSLQELLKIIPNLVIQKIDRINRSTLKQELLNGELPISVLHQYNPYDFDQFVNT